MHKIRLVYMHFSCDRTRYSLSYYHAKMDPVENSYTRVATRPLKDNAMKQFCTECKTGLNFNSLEMYRNEKLK